MSYRGDKKREKTRDDAEKNTVVALLLLVQTGLGLSDGRSPPVQ